MKEEYLEKTANKLGQETKKFVSQGQEELENLVNTCSDTIKKSPIKYTLIAFALGALLGKIFTK